jgi:sugar phosphate isomerase/epimerase
LISRLGFDGASIMLWGDRAHLAAGAVATDPKAWAARVAEQVAACRLTLVDVMCIPGVELEAALNHPSERSRSRSRDLFARMLEFAAHAGAPGVTTLPGPSWPDESHERSLSRSAEELARRARFADDLGLALSIEPNWGSVCRAPSDVTRLCAEVPGLGVTLDCSHFIAEGFGDADVFSLVSQARHVHVRGTCPGHLQARLERSSHDPRGLVDALLAAGYDGHVAVEYFVPPGGEGALDVLTETVRLRDELRCALAVEPSG